jgi:hypothetical protein
MTRGVRGVVLESVLIGGARYTSEEALERFFAAQNPGHVAQPSREAAIAAAERTLAAAGI